MKLSIFAATMIVVVSLFFVPTAAQASDEGQGMYVACAWLMMEQAAQQNADRGYYERGMLYCAYVAAYTEEIIANPHGAVAQQTGEQALHVNDSYLSEQVATGYEPNEEK